MFTVHLCRQAKFVTFQIFICRNFFASQTFSFMNMHHFVLGNDTFSIRKCGKAPIDRTAPRLANLSSNYSWYIEFCLVPRNENLSVELKRNLFRQKRSWPLSSSFMQWITWLLAVKLQQCSTWLQNLLSSRSLQGLSSLFLVILVCTVSS